MAVDTDIFFGKDDVNKNLYRKKTYYTLVVEQEVLANNKDEADNKFTECGINHSKITHDLTDEKDGVETYMVDANYTDSDNTKYISPSNSSKFTINLLFNNSILERLLTIPPNKLFITFWYKITLPISGSNFI